MAILPAAQHRATGGGACSRGGVAGIVPGPPAQEAPMAQPAPDVLALHAVANPQKPAVIDDRQGAGPSGSAQRAEGERSRQPGREPTTWTFAELNAQANRLGNALHGLGIRPGETVVWCGMNSPGVVRMMHAARKAGVTSVPLNYRLTPEAAA